VHDFTLQSDGSSNIAEARDRTNGKRVAVPKWNIGIMRRERLGNFNLLVFALDLGSVLDDVPGKIGEIWLGAALEAARNANQIRSRHAFAQRIFARSFHFTFDLYRSRVGLGQITMNNQPIAWLQEQIISRIAPQRRFQIHAHNFGFPIRATEHLSV
jgi:hypothetical protein